MNQYQYSHYLSKLQSLLHGNKQYRLAHTLSIIFALRLKAKTSVDKQSMHFLADYDKSVESDVKSFFFIFFLH